MQGIQPTKNPREAGFLLQLLDVRVLIGVVALQILDVRARTQQSHAASHAFGIMP